METPRQLLCSDHQHGDAPGRLIAYEYNPLDAAVVQSSLAEGRHEVVAVSHREETYDPGGRK